ncbi:MAG TPA: CAP domain-containing protein [Kofleriaceae bacterium]|nr:CAP domain-containing protein [Kofleriaceae bacterium]
MRIAAAGVCFVLACTTGGVGDDDGTPVDSSAHAFCVTETNRYRTMNGRAAVERSAQLEAYADTGAMIDFNGSPHDHFIQTQGGGIAFAENECPHWDVQQQGGGDMNQLIAACIAAFYSEGPGGGHYENMLGNYGALGCGIYQSGTAVTILQDFGS